VAVPEANPFISNVPDKSDDTSTWVHPEAGLTTHVDPLFIKLLSQLLQPFTVEFVQSFGLHIEEQKMSKL